MLRVAKQEVPLMSEPQEKASATCDPFEAFRSMRDTYLDAMAKTMAEAVNTEAYAQATGTMLEAYLSAVAPIREALDKSMIQALQQLELPSRQEVAALAERFTNVELRLDDMDARLDAMQKMPGQDGSAPGATHVERAGPTAAVEASHGAGNKPAVNRPKTRRPPIRRGVGRRQR
jgi:hypothetical protein